MDEEFIIENNDIIDWNKVSLFRKLSEELIEKFQDKVDWE